MVKIDISKRAHADIEEIKNYVFVETDSEKTAMAAVKRIYKSIDMLSRNPKSGKILLMPDSTDTFYRYLISGKYLIFYRFLGESRVAVDRIIHSARDYMKVLFA